MPNRKKDYILTMTCPDASGISATVLNFIYQNNGFITSSFNYGDPTTKKYFMRTVFQGSDSKFKNLEDTRVKFLPIAKNTKCNGKLRIIVIDPEF